MCNMKKKTHIYEYGYYLKQSVLFKKLNENIKIILKKKLTNIGLIIQYKQISFKFSPYGSKD